MLISPLDRFQDVQQAKPVQADGTISALHSLTFGQKIFIPATHYFLINYKPVRNFEDNPVASSPMGRFRMRTKVVMELSDEIRNENGVIIYHHPPAKRTATEMEANSTQSASSSPSN